MGVWRRHLRGSVDEAREEKTSISKTEATTGAEHSHSPTTDAGAAGKWKMGWTFNRACVRAHPPEPDMFFSQAVVRLLDRRQRGVRDHLVVDAPLPRADVVAVVDEHQRREVLHPLVVLSKGHVDVDHAVDLPAVPPVAPAEHVALAVDAAELLVDVRVADELGLVVDVGPVREIAARQVVGAGDHIAVERQVEVRVVHRAEELVHLLVLVDGPLAEGVLVHVGVGERILVVEDAAVPRKEGHDEDLLAHRRGGDVDAHHVAGLEDRVELHDRVLVGVQLGHRDPHLVAPRRVEDAAELGLQHAEPAADLMEGVGHVSCDDQHVILELQAVDVVHPLLVDTDVEVDVGDPEDPGRPLGPPLVHVEPPLPGFGGLRDHAETLDQAGVEALARQLGGPVQLHRVGEDGVGLLALAAAQQGHAEATVRLGQVRLRVHALLRVLDGGVPHLQLREGG
mmetsp:Transcript_78406/g.243143  ORF Transcript_78406/g.243143 Transcript_78406/m.243143 type:complete len:453 (-) Transcript_78406:1445-2803(-)